MSQHLPTCLCALALTPALALGLQGPALSTASAGQDPAGPRPGERDAATQVAGDQDAGARDAGARDAGPQASAWQSPFPASTAIAEGISPDATEALDALVEGLVDEGEVIGAELLVLVGGRSILHETYGWADREAQRPLEPGSVFCVRSMTKPLVGTAALLLLQEGVLELDTRVAEHLPAFETPELAEVTVEQLLTHTSGLPMSYLIGRDLKSLDGIVAVADLGAEKGLVHAPGERFEYSDQGTDTLTALVEVTSGTTADEFVRTRLLEPLGMAESLTVFPQGHPLRARAVSKYVGAPGAWRPYWTPTDEALFPFFLGSQGLYSTITDYARFCQFWAAGGRTSSERLLKVRWVRKALEPRDEPLGTGSGFPSLDNDYGWLMSLWTEERPAKREGRSPEREVVVFGHNGSDGTHAWIFPEQNAIALYFTQSRGTTSGLQVEEALARMFLGAPFDPSAVAPPVDAYLGYYWEGEGDTYRAVVPHGDGMALEILGKAVVPLAYAGGDSWKLAPQPGTVLDFQRDAEGLVSGYRIGDHQEFRLTPSSSLPAAADLAARVLERHGLNKLAESGPVRRRGSVQIPKLGRSGRIETLIAWPDRYRVDSESDQADGRESVAIQGDAVHLWSSARPLTEPLGPERDALLLDHPFAHFGDWTRWFPTLTVIQRIDEADGDSAYLVRAGDLSGPAPTFYVEVETATVVGVDRMTFLDGIGALGQKVRYGDYRDVGGALLPHLVRTELATPMIGRVELTYDEHELGVTPADGAFALEDRRDG